MENAKFQMANFKAAQAGDARARYRQSHARAPHGRAVFALAPGPRRGYASRSLPNVDIEIFDLVCKVLDVKIELG